MTKASVRSQKKSKTMMTMTTVFKMVARRMASLSRGFRSATRYLRNLLGAEDMDGSRWSDMGKVWGGRRTAILIIGVNG